MSRTVLKTVTYEDVEEALAKMLGYKIHDVSIDIPIPLNDEGKVDLYVEFLEDDDDNLLGFILSNDRSDSY